MRKYIFINKSNSSHRGYILLGIQTEYQCDAMQYHGAKVICMDSMHGTNVYDFMLVSIIVVDNYGEGLPVAWALTNHEVATVLVEFLKELKARTGDIHPEIFMLD